MVGKLKLQWVSSLLRIFQNEKAHKLGNIGAFLAHQWGFSSFTLSNGHINYHIKGWMRHCYFTSSTA